MMCYCLELLQVSNGLKCVSLWTKKHIWYVSIHRRYYYEFWNNLYTQGGAWTHNPRVKVTCSTNWAREVPLLQMFLLMLKLVFDRVLAFFMTGCSQIILHIFWERYFLRSGIDHFSKESWLKKVSWEVNIWEKKRGRRTGQRKDQTTTWQNLSIRGPHSSQLGGSPWREWRRDIVMPTKAVPQA